jgi:hypothetical protein
MVTRGRRCPFIARCAAVSLQARRNTALCFFRIGVCRMSWRLRCRHELATAYARTTPSINEVRFTPCHASRIAPSTVAPRTVRGPPLARAGCCVAPSMCLAASKRVARALLRAGAPWVAKPRATASLRAFHATGTGFALSLAIGSTWIRRECNTKYSLQHRSGQRRPPNSVIDWVRGTPFLFPESRCHLPYGVARDPAH